MSQMIHSARAVFGLPAVASASIVRRGVALKVVKEQAPAVKQQTLLPVVEGEAPKVSLTSILDQYLYNRNKEDPEHEIPVNLGGIRRRGVFHPSDLCHADSICHRYLAYELYEAPKVDAVDARLRRIFDNGHFVHARLQFYLREAMARLGGKFYREIGLGRSAKRVAGTTDGGFIINEWPYLVEIKSMNKSDFNSLGAKPWDDHFDQLNIYMHLARVRAGIVLIECKDNQDYKDYFIRYDESRWNTTRDVVNLVLEVVGQGQLPDKITEADGCTGKRCKFHPICKGNQQWAPQGALK